jgi:hypothetical protein
MHQDLRYDGGGLACLVFVLDGRRLGTWGLPFYSFALGWTRSALLQISYGSVCNSSFFTLNRNGASQNSGPIFCFPPRQRTNESSESVQHGGLRPSLGCAHPASGGRTYILGTDSRREHLHSQFPFRPLTRVPSPC